MEGWLDGGGMEGWMPVGNYLSKSPVICVEPLVFSSPCSNLLPEKSCTLTEDTVDFMSVLKLHLCFPVGHSACTTVYWQLH